MENYKGDTEDTRTDEQKAQDYNHYDLGFGVPVIWKEKTLLECKSFTSREQDGSLSCGGQAGSKGVETLAGHVMSAHPIYRPRPNYPDGGMWIQAIGDILLKKSGGTCLEELDPSQRLGESFLNKDIIVPTPYKISGYVQPSQKNIEEIAQAIETYGHCILLIHANGNEWIDKPFVSGLVNNFGHFICATDYLLLDGIKTLLIEDSTEHQTSLAPNFNGQRYITEDFLKAKCDGAIYFTSVNPLEIPYIFTKTLRVGSRGFDVKKLQGKLNVKIDGIFGRDTKFALLGFQLRNNLFPDGVAGPKTNLVLSKINN